MRWGVDQARRAWVEPGGRAEHPLRARTSSPGSRRSRAASDSTIRADDQPGRRTANVCRPERRPSAVLARRELVVAAVVVVALTRAVESADAFLIAGLLPVVMLAAGVGVLRHREPPARARSRHC